MSIKRVGIVGSGIMGSGIAETLAVHGFEVVLRSRAQSTAEGMVAAMEKSLDGEAPALNSAIPAAQYMAEEKEPAKDCGLAELRSWEPPVTVAIDGPVEFCCVSSA